MVLEQADSENQLFRGCRPFGQLRFQLRVFLQEVQSAGQVDIAVRAAFHTLEKIAPLGADKHGVVRQVLGVCQGQGNRAEVPGGHTEPLLVAFQQLTQIQEAVFFLEGAAGGAGVQEDAVPPQGRAFSGAGLRRVPDESNDVVQQRKIDGGPVSRQFQGIEHEEPSLFGKLRRDDRRESSCASCKGRKKAGSFMSQRKRACFILLSFVCKH